MSVESAREFLTTIRNSDEMRQRILNGLDIKNSDAQLARFVEVGAASGYSFTPDEYQQAMKGDDWSDRSGELSDDQLEGVAGGDSWPVKSSSISHTFGGC